MKILSKYIGFLAFTLLLLCTKNSYAQKQKDTIQVLKDWNKVMAFFIQPYLAVKTHTSIQTSPILDTKDTLSTNGLYYKMLGQIYSSSGMQEHYTQDSFMVTINHTVKKIMIRKGIVADKLSPNILPLSQQHLQQYIMEHSVIAKRELENNVFEITISTQANENSITNNNTTISIQYNNLFEPLKFIVSNKLKMDVNEDVLNYLNIQKIDTAQLIKTIEDKRYIIREQKMIVEFEQLKTTKEFALLMPKLKDKFSITNAGKDIFPLEEYSNYQLIKTF